MSCFSGCYETPDGGVCNPCPDWFEGDGLTCRDIREHCNSIKCPEGCEETESGGKCVPCKPYHFSSNNACIDARIYCKDKILGL